MGREYPAIAYEEWKSKTSYLFGTRSTELKELDIAIKAYDEVFLTADEKMIKIASKAVLDKYKKWEGLKTPKVAGGNYTGRDQKYIEDTIYELRTNVIHVRAKLTEEEIRAFKELARRDEAMLSILFKDKKLVPKNTGVEDLKKLGADIKGAVKSGSKQESPDIKSTLTSVFSLIGIPPEGFANIVTDFALLATPFVGDVTAIMKVLKQIKEVVEKKSEKKELHSARHSFQPGSPAAAFIAIEGMVDEEIRRCTQNLAINSINAAVKLIPFSTAIAPVTAALKILAETTIKIADYRASTRQAEAANTLLTNPGSINLDIFQTSPLLGCYYIACSDTSTIIRMAMSRYGTADWNIRVEEMVDKAKPVFDKATELIKASHFHIPELANYKGVVQPKTKFDRCVVKMVMKINAAISGKNIADRIVGFGSSS